MTIPPNLIVDCYDNFLVGASMTIPQAVWQAFAIGNRMGLPYVFKIIVGGKEHAGVSGDNGEKMSVIPYTTYAQCVIRSMTLPKNVHVM